MRLDLLSRRDESWLLFTPAVILEEVEVGPNVLIRNSLPRRELFDRFLDPTQSRPRGLEVVKKYPTSSKGPDPETSVRLLVALTNNEDVFLHPPRQQEANAHPRYPSDHEGIEIDVPKALGSLPKVPLRTHDRALKVSRAVDHCLLQVANKPDDVVRGTMLLSHLGLMRKHRHQLVSELHHLAVAATDDDNLLRLVVRNPLHVHQRIPLQNTRELSGQDGEPTSF